MKISYNTLKRIKKDIKAPEEISKDLIMHTAEVEGIKYDGENLKNVFIGEVKECEKHPNSEKLNCIKVEINGKTYPIVCGAPNVKAGIKVPVAMVGAKLKEDFIIEKTKIRGETSEGMICSEDELGLIEERQEGILELDKNAPLGISMKEYLGKNESILEVDNKAINHRPDLFSQIGILREICAISGEKLEYKYENRNFGNLKALGIKNKIPEKVSRYIGLKVKGVSNIESPKYIKELLKASDCISKGLLVDLSNYSLYLYGQPTHIFDADKLEGNIKIRYAKKGEKILALNDKEYELSDTDIVIVDKEKVIAIAGIIGGKNSCVDENTKNIIIESANFDHANLRISGKKLGLRTDSLNIFEKEIMPKSAKWGVSLIIKELEKEFENIELESYSDCYEKKQETREIEYDLEFINKLIGKKYNEEKVIKILDNLGIDKIENKLIVPSWRKELKYKADIAEEIARIDGYNEIKSEIPNIQLGSVIQNNTYKTKLLARNFFTKLGFFDMYTYSFVNKKIMNMCNNNIENLIPLKNFLSEDATHMKDSLIPNLLMSIQKNKLNFKNLKLFEVEKIFKYEKENNKINEQYNISGLIITNENIAYYKIQNIISKFLKEVGVTKYEFKIANKIPNYAHNTRTASIISRGKEIGIVGEIKPIVAKNFDIKEKIGFFEINLDKLKDMINSITKAKDLSDFQSSSFDISFLIAKKLSGKKLQNTISKTDQKLIEKVELFDIYEDYEKLGDNRSVSFKIYLQKMDSEINDKEKNQLIENIIKKATKFGALHR